MLSIPAITIERSNLTIATGFDSI